MLRCKECEHCGMVDNFENVKYSMCGKVRFAKPVIDEEKAVNFIGRVKLQCTNCVYCRLYAGAGIRYICLNYDEDEFYSSYYDLVEPTDLCKKFIPIEAIEKK